MNRGAPHTHQVLVGHDTVAVRLKNAFDTNALHHAIILHGPDGVGKETLAYMLVRYALHYPNGNPARADFIIPETSRTFTQIAAQSHPNIFVISPVYDEKKERFKTDITLDALGGLHDFLRLAPTDGGPRFVIVNPSEYLNRATQNALLKVLEEPPQKTFFLLLTARPNALLATTRSRCLEMSMNALNRDDFARATNLSGADADRFFALSGGSPGRAAHYQQSDILEAYGEFCRAMAHWADDNNSTTAMRFAETYGPAAFDAVADRLVGLWLERLCTMTKARILGRDMPTLIPEEAHILNLWNQASPQELVVRYDRLEALWAEAEASHLDRKLVLLRALAIVGGHDTPKAA